MTGRRAGRTPGTPAGPPCGDPDWAPRTVHVDPELILARHFIEIGKDYGGPVTDALELHMHILADGGAS